MDTNEFLHYLRHYRHDWLNHIQIIKAYLALDKVEDAQRYMDQVILSTQNESKLCQLGHAELAYYLLTYNWRENKPILADIEIISAQDMSPSISLEKQYPLLYQWVRELTEVVEQKVDQEEENRLYYIFNIEDNRLTLRIEFEGVWEEKTGQDAFCNIKNKIDENQGKLTIEHCSASEFMLELIP